MAAWQPIFDWLLFQKIETPIFRGGNITVFFAVMFMFLVHISGFEYFSFNFGTFLNFWRNLETQDGCHLAIMT